MNRVCDIQKTEDFLPKWKHVRGGTANDVVVTQQVTNTEHASLEQQHTELITPSFRKGKMDEPAKLG